VAEPVRGRAELDRHERVAARRLVELIAARQHVADHRLPGNLRQVLIDQQPLVVPESDLPGNEELRVALREVCVACRRERTQAEAAEVGQDPVVEQDVGAVQPRDHDVLVVARVARQGRVAAISVRHPGHVLVYAASADLQCRPD
jgi:hypothetical protein